MNCSYSFILAVMPANQQAWIWLLALPFLAFASGVVIGVILENSTPTVGKKLGVIGMKGAGKTTYLSHLGLVEHDGGGTKWKTYEAKMVHVGNRDLKIASGMDIGGEEGFVKLYKPWLIGDEKKDIIIFIFNGYRYLNDEEYGKDTRSRLDFIYNTYKQANNDVKEYKNIVLMASHLDEYVKKDKYSGEDVKKMQDDIIKSVASKEYDALFKNNFFVVDLRNKEFVDKINNKIFA